MLVALLGALFLFSALPAQAQTPTLQFTSNSATVREGDTLTLILRPSAAAAVSGSLTYGNSVQIAPADLSADVGSERPTTFSLLAADDHSLIEIPTVDNTVNDGARAFTVTIAAGTGYTVGANGTVTVTIQDDDPPAAPGNLEVTARDGGLDVSWAKPDGPVASYQVRHKTSSAPDSAATRRDPSTGWVTATWRAHRMTVEITGLTPGTDYDVQVRAKDTRPEGSNDGYGPWTATQSGTPSGTPTNQPPPDTDTPTNTGGPGTGGGGGGGVPPRDTPSPDDDPTPDSDTPTRCGENDREDLISFYEATGGDAWDRSENWKSEEPLGDWFGVETDEDGEVISLRLADNGLSGDMPTEELLCLNENTELKELALWDNDLSGDVPDELVWAVERAALRAIAEMFDIYPLWFEDYEDPFDFEDWHEGVTTDDEGRVTGLDLTGEGAIGEIPEILSEQLQKLREIMITTSSEGCAVGASSAHMGTSGLLAAVFIMLLAVSRGFRARSY